MMMVKGNVAFAGLPMQAKDSLKIHHLHKIPDKGISSRILRRTLPKAP
jgi:hypothetical protein